MQSELQIKAPDKREAGFSLIELIVSTVIFLIFISAVYGLLRIGRVQRDTVSGQVEVIKNARLALNTIGRDAVNAGLSYSSAMVPDDLMNKRMGLPADSNSALDTLTAVVSGNNITSSTDDILDGSDAVSFAFHNINSNGRKFIKLANAEQSGNGGVTIYARLTSDDASSKPLNGDLYRISVGAGNALGLVTDVSGVNVSFPIFTESGITYYTSFYQLTFGNNDPLEINLPHNNSENILSSLTCSHPVAQVNKCFSSGEPTAEALKTDWVSYHVNNNGTLIRRTYGNNAEAAVAADQIQDQPIAYNIENLQISYLLEDGTISDDPSTHGTAGNIVQLDVSISAKADIDTVGGVSTEKTINLRSTFSTKNLHYTVIPINPI